MVSSRYVDLVEGRWMSSRGMRSPDVLFVPEENRHRDVVFWNWHSLCAGLVSREMCQDTVNGANCKGLASSFS